MLKGLAEYSMSGRRQAATVAILLVMFPMLNLLSGGVVALVTLRKGGQEGFMLMLWALLPAGVQLLVGDASPVFLVIAAFLGAQVLRQSNSWQLALVVLTALGLVTQLSLAFQPAYIAQINELFTLMMAEGRSVPIADADTISNASAEEMVAILLHFYGAYHVVAFIISLAIGRYWQALLYNPGGFKQEFHALRLDKRIAGVFLAMLAAGELGIAPFSVLAPLFCIAPLINGLALSHYLVALRKLGSNWLILTYLLAVFLAPAIIALGFLDSFADIRSRARPSKTDSTNKEE